MSLWTNRPVPLIWRECESKGTKANSFPCRTRTLGYDPCGLREAGHAAPQIAERLNAEGFYPPKRSGKFTIPVIYQLLKRRALIGNERSHDELLGNDEWWLTDLARDLAMSHLKLRDWTNRGWLHSRKTPLQGRWILWADQDEVARLRELLEQSRRGMNAYTSELKTPKERPKAS